MEGNVCLSGDVEADETHHVNLGGCVCLRVCVLGCVCVWVLEV